MPRVTGKELKMYAEISEISKRKRSSGAGERITVFMMATIGLKAYRR
jgi:hypothetical protein